MADTPNTRRRNAPLPRERNPKRSSDVAFGGNTKRNYDAEVAWLGVIEYLASKKEIDSATLYELLDAAPEFPKELEKNAKEMVALRCLEELFGTSERPVHEGPCVNGDEDGFDVSMSCEKVLQCIIDLTSQRKVLKWDIHPFIMHKRASIPQCALEQMKDAILEGKHPCTSIWREHSRLAQRNDTHHPAACVAGASKVNDSRSAVRDIASTENSPKALQNDAAVGGDSYDGNSLICETNREFSIDFLMEDYYENDDGNDLNSEAKKSKQDGKQPMDCILVSEYGKEYMEHASGSMDKSDHIEARKLNGASSVRTEEDAFVGQAMESGDIGNQMKSLNVGSLGAYHGKVNLEDAEGNKEPLSKDDASSADEVDICTRKNQFLRSQCPLGYDSLPVMDWTEANLCIKCNEDLVCSQLDCPLAEHENFLAAPAGFDNRGNFYCPNCFYSYAFAEHAEAMQRESLARTRIDGASDNSLEHHETHLRIRG